ncbi:MAG: hypothetical protein NZ553_00370 [Caldilinea sp.]|nr:hypothetical protein [Caldilinea sp.]MDW8438902.1 hypothetical protein [Caldilineaceae bacterium]
MLVGAIVVGCAHHRADQPVVEVREEVVEQKPEPTVIKTYAAHDYRYLIYGDPLVAPAQAFSDGRFLYLQLKPEQAPPLAYTRTGEIVEYDLIKNVMKLPKLDSVVLRMGPRKAFVDHRDVNIVHYGSSNETVVEVRVERPMLDKMTFGELDDTSLLEKWFVGARTVEVCHAPTVRETKLAIKVANVLRSIGVVTRTRINCAEDGVVDLTRIN